MCLNPFPVRIEKWLSKAHISKIKTVEYVPCGRCPECRTLRRLQWTFRLEQESLQHEYNYFVTLTYSDDWIPLDGQIYKPDFVGFVKRLRTIQYRQQKRIQELARPGVSFQWKDYKTLLYFGCGEYGETFGRCHFHSIIFSDYPIDDDMIRRCWPYGFIKISAFTSQRAAYVVKYSQKQLFYDLPENVQPPCSLSSQGLGSSYFTPSVVRYLRYTKQTVVYTFNGSPVPIPRIFYNQIFTDQERRQLRLARELERFRKDELDISDFGINSKSKALGLFRERKWQSAYDNYLSKPIKEFHYYECAPE